MSQRLLQSIRDIALWVTPIIVLLLAVFVFNMPLWFAVPLALLVLGALYFILNPRTSVQESQDQVRFDTDQALRDARDQVRDIRSQSAQVKKPDVRDQILKICAMAEDILRDLLGNPNTSLLTATRLKHTFTQTSDILKFYTDLVNGKVTLEADKRAALALQIEHDLLDQLQTSLREFAAKQDEGEVVSLEATLKTLENTLKLEGLA